MSAVDEERFPVLGKDERLAILISCPVAFVCSIWVFFVSGGSLAVAIPVCCVLVVVGWGIGTLVRFDKMALVTSPEGVRLQRGSRVLRQARWNEITGYSSGSKEDGQAFEIHLDSNPAIIFPVLSMQSVPHGLLRQLDKWMPPSADRDRPPRPTNRLERVFYDAYDKPDPVEMVEGIWYRYIDSHRVDKLSHSQVWSLLPAAIAPLIMLVPTWKHLGPWSNPALVLISSTSVALFLHRAQAFTRMRKFAHSEFRILGDRLEIRDDTGAFTSVASAARKGRFTFFMGAHLTRFGAWRKGIWIDTRLLVPSSDYTEPDPEPVNRSPLRWLIR